MFVDQVLISEPATTLTLSDHTHIPGTLLVTDNGDPGSLQSPGPVSALLHPSPARQHCPPPAAVIEILINKLLNVSNMSKRCTAIRPWIRFGRKTPAECVANLVQINWQFRPQIKNSGQHTALGRHAGQTFLSSQRSISGFFSFKIAMSFSYIDTFKELKRNFLRSQACPLHFPNRAV